MTKSVLYLLHNWGGGSEKHLLDIVGYIKNEYVFYILKPTDNGLELDQYIERNKTTYTFNLNYRWNISTFFSKEYRNILEKIINTFEIRLIHIQHLIGHTFDVFDLTIKYKIPLIISLHDFYIICPKIFMVDEELEFCHNKNNRNKCSRCLIKMGLNSKFILKWRKQFEIALTKCDLIIAPSNSVFDIINNYYRLDKNKLLKIEHGNKQISFKLSSNIQNNEDIKTSKKINIMCVGGISPIKGENVLYNLAKSTFNKNIDWFIIGFSSSFNIPGYYPKYNIHITGKYENEEELFRIIQEKNIHLAILPSICPETYSFTLSEVWMAGVPPIVSDRGALKERVEGTECGWIVSPDTKSSKDKINEILSNPEMYYKVKNKIQEIKLKSIESMAEEYQTVYDDIIKNHNIIKYSSNIFKCNELTKSLVNSNLSKIPNNKVPKNLFERLIQCYYEHGLRYTLNKIISLEYLNQIKKEKD